MRKENKIAIIGLGYVGMPLALAFSRYYKVIGYDVNKKRVSSLQEGTDSNLNAEIPVNSNLVFSSDENAIKEANIYIVTVPTPVNEENIPDLSFLESASQIVAKYLTEDNIVIYETLFDGEYVFSEVDKPGVFGVVYDDLEQNNEIPESVNILSCYPNPFNPNLNIEYIIDNPSSVIIEVYDLQGRKINV